MKSLLSTALLAFLFFLGAPLASARAGDCCGAKRAQASARKMSVCKMSSRKLSSDERAVPRNLGGAASLGRLASTKKSCGCYRGCTCSMCTCMKGPGHPPEPKPEGAALVPPGPRVPDPSLCCVCLLAVSSETQNYPPLPSALALPSLDLYHRREGLLRGMMILPLRR
ncbi:MAG TPA: hypothetical protein ENK02_05520 [Planctomycetes bacterium]|nr:hypothetical protein [Planctomycetota bacterium]